MDYDDWVARSGPRLRAALVAAYGPEVGVEATADAMAYGWEHWARLREMGNPTGYLYRVGQTAARRHHRPQGFLPARPEPGLPEFEPGLAPALEQLTEPQRVAVVLLHSLGWSTPEVAEVLDVSVSTVRTHGSRGLDKLRLALRVGDHVQ